MYNMHRLVQVMLTCVSAVAHDLTAAGFDVPWLHRVAADSVLDAETLAAGYSAHLEHAKVSDRFWGVAEK